MALREADDPRCQASATDHLIQALNTATARHRDQQPHRLLELLAASTGLTGVLASHLPTT